LVASFVRNESGTRTQRPDLGRGVIQLFEIMSLDQGRLLAGVLRLMTRPRRIVPETSWMLTRRCSQRQFMMRPDDEMNNAFLYCLIEAAQKFRVDLLLAQMMSNHEHVEYYDRLGNGPAFYHRFHTHLAKCVNALRGRWENMFSSEEPCLVELSERRDLLEKLVYIATNPVKDGLVEKVHHWPGPKIVQALLTGQPLKATRPSFLFRDDGPMPEAVEIILRIPEELGSHDEIVAQLRVRIAEVEAVCARVRAETGRQVVGRKRILRQSWRDSPKSQEPRRNLRPRIAARSKWERIARLQRNREFDKQYRESLLLLRAGTPVVFPLGTYWLRLYANVETEAFVSRRRGPPTAVCN
jgi:putative transposase